MIRFVTKFEGRRLRARRVDEEGSAKRVRRQALNGDDWVVDVDHGGDVANAYAYPAETECVLAISDPFGATCVWVGRTRANMVTLRGAALACFSPAADLFDERIKNPERKAKALEALREAHSKQFSAMEIIALAAS